MALCPIFFNRSSTYRNPGSVLDWLRMELSPYESSNTLPLENILNEILNSDSLEQFEHGLLEDLLAIDRPLRIRFSNNSKPGIKRSSIPSILEKFVDLKRPRRSEDLSIVPNGFWNPRRVDKDDSVEWHLEGDTEWIRPQDVEVSVDSAHRTVDFRAKREKTQTISCGNKKHNSEEEPSEKCPNCSTVTSMRETTRSFTLPDDVDLDKVEANMSSDHSSFVIRAPRKRPLSYSQSPENLRIPVKISRVN